MKLVKNRQRLVSETAAQNKPCAALTVIFVTNFLCPNHCLQGIRQFDGFLIQGHLCNEYNNI